MTRSVLAKKNGCESRPCRKSDECVDATCRLAFFVPITFFFPSEDGWAALAEVS